MDIFLTIGLVLALVVSIVSVLIGAGCAVQLKETRATMELITRAIQQRITRDELIKNLEESADQVVKKVLKEMAN